MMSSFVAEPLVEGAADVFGVLLFDEFRSTKLSNNEVWRD